MDKLIKYVNMNTAKTGVKARYALLSDYVAAVNALNLEWPVYEGEPPCRGGLVKGSTSKYICAWTGDFFPYADGTSNASYWSGYFTSRIGLKGSSCLPSHVSL